MGRRSDGPACLLVCAGKDCRGDKGFDALVDLAEGMPHAYALPCQGLCDGPIAGVRVDGSTYWFEQVRTAKVRDHLVRFVRTGRRSDRLRELEVRKHRDVVKSARRATPLGKRSRRGALA
jgi:hypothetical protein